MNRIFTDIIEWRAIGNVIGRRQIRVHDSLPFVEFCRNGRQGEANLFPIGIENQVVPPMVGFDGERNAT